MSEEKKFENEELTTEEITEVVEETVEEVEAAEEVVEEAVEEIAEEAEEAEAAYNEYEDEISAEEADQAEYSDEEGEIVFDEEAVADLENLDGVNKANTNTTTLAIGAVAALVVIAVAVLYFMGYFGIWFNKYNKQYIDTTGRTIEDVAEASGMTLKEFLKEYDLPSNMPKNTYESAAFYTMPAEKAAEIYGMAFEDLKEQLQLGDDVDPKDPWGEVEGEVTFNVYVGGEEYVQQVKELYGLGDEINGETKWKEIRPLIDAKQKEMREEQEKLAAEAEANAASEESAGEGAEEAQEAPAAE